ncbi:MAG TPA: hypothetical protein VD838_16025 [Anaeromyxobacteraceae bacterium]|nr:hypothetical protein [Anaeromyxobacteraceae bacterium]
MSRFGIAQISLNGTLRAGVRGYQLDRGLEIESDGSDGVVYETAHHLIAAKPMADITSLSLKTMLSALNDSTDLPLESLDGASGLVMYGQKAASNAPGFASGSVHLTRTGLRGLIYMAGLRWSRGSKAEMALRAMFKAASGETDPITAGSGALPTQPTPDLGFALSSLTLAGDTIDTVNSFEIGIDPKFEFEYSTGLPYPTDITGAGANGKLAITGRADLGDCDLGDGEGSCVAVFKRYAIGGGFGSDTVTLTLNAAWSTEEGIGGENGSPMGRNLFIRTRHDGSTKPFTWQLA